MSLPEITMPDPPPEPEPQVPLPQTPSEVRSEPVNYDDTKVDVDKLDEVIEELKPQPPAAVDESVPMKVKPVLEDESVFKDVVKKPRVKSQKQLDHLAKAREKALAVRQAKAKEKKQVKFAEQATVDDPRPKEQKESVILHMSVAEFQKLQRQSNLDAVESYDTKRKLQKQAKREAKEEYTKANRVNQQINKALGVPDPDDMWAVCFQ